MNAHKCETILSALNNIFLMIDIKNQENAILIYLLSMAKLEMEEKMSKIESTA